MRFLKSIHQTSVGARLRALAVLAVLAMAAAACQSASIAVTQATILNGNDEVEFFDGNDEEPYVAIVTWRTTPGQAGSSSVSVLPITGLGTTAPGSTVAIPPANGKSSFSNISPYTFAAFNSGAAPDLIGTITVAMDADNASASSTPDPLATNQLLSMSGFIQAELADHFESLTLNTSSTAALAAQLNGAVSDFLYTGESPQDHARATLGSLQNDDLVGVATTTRIPVDGQLAGIFSTFGDGVSEPDDAATMVAGTETYDTVVSFGGSWDLTFEVTL